MKIEMARRQLGDLGEAAGQRQPRYGMAAQIFEHAAGEITHVDQSHVVKTVHLLDRRLRGPAGRRRDVI